MKFATKAIHVGSEPDALTGALMSPIYMTSTFLQDEPGVNKGYDYTRANNPNFMRLEKQLAALEGAEFATVFSSGIGALAALVTTLSSGDRIVALEGVYGGTYRLFHQIFNRFGIAFEAFNPSTSTGRQGLEAALTRNPKWLFFETPTNPILEVHDIAFYVALAHRHGALAVVDNTFASPYCQNPLDFGADIVWHSCTKYLGGHSDVIGGVAMSNNEALKKDLDFARKSLGVNPSPFDTWLVMRGVKTLAVRMQQHQQNAMAVAMFLESHPKVKRVYYPGLPSHPQHQIAKKQMHGFSGMLSAEFNLSPEETRKLIATFRLFALAESLGGVESLVSYPAIMTHAAIPPAERERIGISDSLVRFSIGIEDSDDLIDDLKEALQKV